jgi:hypothetical protein
MPILWCVLAWFMSTQALAAETSEAVPRFVSFPTIIVNTSDGVGYNGLFSVKLQFLVKSLAAHEQITALRPQYQDALTQATYRLGQLYVDPRKPIPWARLTQEFNKAARRVDPKIALRVLIVEATTRATR